MSSKNKYLGEFEQVTLLALIKLGKNAYGATIRQLIHDEIGRDVAIGALYSTLERLEAKGLAKSSFGSDTPKRGGRPKKHFEVTPLGQQALTRSRDAMAIMWQGVSLRAWAIAIYG